MKKIKPHSDRRYLSLISVAEHTNAWNDTIFDSKEFDVTAVSRDGVGLAVFLVYESRYYFIVCVEIDNVLAITIYFPPVIPCGSFDKS